MKVHGYNSVVEAIKAKKVNKIYVGKMNKKVRALVEMAKKAGCPVYRDPKAKEVYAEISPIAYSSVEEIEKKALEEGSFILILDNVSDPQNLGACIRSAEFFGCAGVIVRSRRVAQVTESVVRASAGAVFHVKIAREENLVNTIKKLKKNFFVFALELKGKDIRLTKLSPPLVLVVGGEDKGTSESVLKQCDEVVKIPGIGKISSLNLSAVCSIVMFEIFKNREVLK